MNSLNVHFAPFIPEIWLAGLAAAGLVLLILSFLSSHRVPFWRLLAFAGLMAALSNPTLLEEERKSVPDVAVIVIDQSPSQSMMQRAERAAEAKKYLEEELGSIEDLDVRLVEAPALTEDIASETRLFETLDRTLADVPQSRRAGVFIVTDGQVHDVPKTSARWKEYGPVHTLLTGEKREKDRRIVMTKAPAFGIVGQDIELGFKIEQSGVADDSPVRVSLRLEGGTVIELEAIPGAEQTVNVPLEHAGQNVFELQAAELPGEITAANNRAVVLVNGVRDRLRVLLVSGQPHAGGRTWRDLLTSDPGVDLVHFTILREPSKLDNTPQDELSLIAFPFRELFEIKLYEFDLIIFDRYRLNDVVPDRYFGNIARFVEKGGALLAASGPDDAGQRSIVHTSLEPVLPSIPTGQVFEGVFKPAISKAGLYHPVTRDLASMQTLWGPWMRQIDIVPKPGTDILMQGADEKPLLLLSRTGEGRVAQFASDHVWLWSRGYEGGGPYADLLRRVVHWLMKEPELDERALDVSVHGKSIRIRTWDRGQGEESLTMTKPDGVQEPLTLKSGGQGWMEHRINAESLGIYGFETSLGQRRFAVVGDLNPPELQAVLTTPDVLKPLNEASGGGAVWLSENSSPDIRSLQAGRENFSGLSWLGLRRNNEYTVSGVKTAPLLPPWGWLILLAGLSVFAWWREGRT